MGIWGTADSQPRYKVPRCADAFVEKLGLLGIIGRRAELRDPGDLLESDAGDEERYSGLRVRRRRCVATQGEEETLWGSAGV